VAALKNFRAVGGDVPAGIDTGYEMLLVGSVQEPIQACAGAVLMDESALDNVCEPAVRVVDVIVRFQPAPLPLASNTVNPNEYVVV
jgi:hypothetical protein